MDREQNGAGGTIVFNQSLSKGLFDYWNALRNGRPLPPRRELDPGQLRVWLPRLALLEQLGPYHTVFRLAGTTICAAFGRELRDHALCTLWRGDDRERIDAAIGGCLRESLALVIGFEAHALDRRPLAGEMVLMPMLDDAGTPTRLLAGFATEPETPRLPSKPFLRLQLSSIGRIRPDRDHVVLDPIAKTPALPRPVLAIVENHAGRGVTQPATSSGPNVARPWGRLIKEFWCPDDQ